MMKNSILTKKWTVSDSEELYNFSGWGRDYFRINSAGHVVATPTRDGRTAIDIKELIDDAHRKGFDLPLLIRFSDILKDRLHFLHRCFQNAIREKKYSGNYLGLYPIKVNPQRRVIEEVLTYGSKIGIGLEVGSKPELCAVLAAMEKTGSVVVCNGYKDPTYIRLALHGQKLGKRVFLVLEKLSELAPILDIAAQEGLTPNLGVRLKLVSSGSGKWEDSGGDRSKFGLTASDLLEVVAALKKAKRISSFKLVHIHLGSQLTNIRRIKEAIREATRIFVELRRLGCPVEYVDFGGGLGVDYDGSRNTGGFSMNYTEQEYANDIVGAVAEACRAGEISAPPTIMTESGRALSAHHCMLAVRVVETASYDSDRPAGDAREDKPETLEKLEKILAGINRGNFFEFWHDALHLRDEANDLFKMGSFSLLDRASVDGAFWKIARGVEGILAKEKRIPEDFEPLRTLLADKYYCNFSVFQSLPDAWAMLQEFPVVPLHRLTEFPARRGILQDITCDADGQLRNYIGPAGQQSTVALHPLKSGEPYYIGIFLTGAYQEILGEYHNLFGDTNIIHVALGAAGGWHYEQAIDGEKIAQVLEFAQFQRHALIDRIERQVRGSIKAGRLTSLEGREIREFYVRALDGLTYLEPAAEKKTEKRAGARAAAV